MQPFKHPDFNQMNYKAQRNQENKMKLEQMREIRRLQDEMARSGKGLWSPEARQIAIYSNDTLGELDKLDDARMDALVMDARQGLTYLDMGRPDLAAEIYASRYQALQDLPGSNADQTGMILATMRDEMSQAEKEGDPINGKYDQTRKLLTAMSKMKDPSGGRGVQRIGSPTWRKNEKGDWVLQQAMFDTRDNRTYFQDVEGGEGVLNPEQELALKQENEIKTESRKNIMTENQGLIKDNTATIKAMQSENRKLGNAIKYLDEGASIGWGSWADKYVNPATAKLQSMIGNLGLGVVGSTTFGALSEGELKLALAVAVPEFESESAAREYFRAKAQANKRLLDEAYRYQKFLRQGGLTEEFGDPSSEFYVEFTEKNPPSAAVDYDFTRYGIDSADMAALGIAGPKQQQQQGAEIAPPPGLSGMELAKWWRDEYPKLKAQQGAR
jgi:hypothetical protein